MNAYTPSQKSLLLAGLRSSLNACAAVLFSDNYLEYLRTAFRDGPCEAVELALQSGHSSLIRLLQGFLNEAARRQLLPPLDSRLEAELLIAQVQGEDWIRALMCGVDGSDERLSTRIDLAISGFQHRYLKDF